MHRATRPEKRKRGHHGREADPKARHVHSHSAGKHRRAVDWDAVHCNFSAILSVPHTVASAPSEGLSHDDGEPLPSGNPMWDLLTAVKDVLPDREPVPTPMLTADDVAVLLANHSAMQSLAPEPEKDSSPNTPTPTVTTSVSKATTRINESDLTKCVLHACIRRRPLSPQPHFSLLVTQISRQECLGTPIGQVEMQAVFRRVSEPNCFVAAPRCRLPRSSSPRASQWFRVVCVGRGVWCFVCARRPCRYVLHKILAVCPAACTTQAFVSGQ